jgi:thioredoxin-like negative regulator of GroEL
MQDWYITVVSPNLPDVDDDSFEKIVMRSSRPVLVDFWSPRCAPCYALAHELEKLSAEVGDRLLIVKINVDENPRVRGEFEIVHLPALGLFEKGEFIRFIGGLGRKDAIKAALGLDG